MFCPDHSTIFDHDYKAYVSDRVGVSGWGNVSHPNHILKLFSLMYWFRRRARRDESFRLLKRILQTSFQTAKSMIFQILSTINGVLSKMFLTSGELQLGYEDIALWTQDMFVQLSKDYTSSLPLSGIFEALKDFSNFVKQYLSHEDIKQSSAILDYGFPRSLAPIQSFFDKYRKKLTSHRLGTHGVGSLQWYLDMTIWSQSRNMGYLPRYLSERTRKNFYQLVTCETIVSKFELLTIRTLARKGFPQSFPNQTLVLSLPVNPRNQEFYSHFAFDLKQTGSLSSSVEEGGRLEDARLTMQILHGQQIPIKDLSTGEITRFCSITEHESAEAFLFWYSYQKVIDSLESKDFSSHLGNLFDVKILHINEPAKERVLCKGNSILYWFLTPAAKLLQHVLATHPDHKEGLLGASQGWKLQQEFGPTGRRNKWMFDPSGNTHASTTICDGDWAQASDTVPKIVGLLLLREFMAFVGFPHDYGGLVLRVLEVPLTIQPNTDLAKYGSGDKVHTGFMMGFPITKAILHLAHFVAKEFAIQFNRSNSVREGHLEPFVGPIVLPASHRFAN